MKLLLIEDNASLAHWLAQLLREQDFVVDCVADGEAADQLLRQQRYDVVLLDLNLPQLSGKGVLRRLRERGDGVPVLILTASASLDQKVLCLEIGADDYMVKPIEGRELVARIKALVRR
ncbi:MAG: response regulator transcription factor, partial [Proteobacteria bacterium]|nr:response regulator transcription factor [Pseudomonadota bacterium]